MEKLDAEAISLEAERMVVKLPDLPVAVVIFEEHLTLSQVMLAVPLDRYHVVVFGNMCVVGDR